jgi:hypothetical protein
MKKLTEFQERVLETIKKGPNGMANWWEVAWNGFSKEWNGNRSSHGILITNIQKAAKRLSEEKIIVILPPKDEYSAATYCIL